LAQDERFSHTFSRTLLIESFTYDGLLIYTKGTIKRVDGKEYFYLFISSKKSVGQ